ncbi:MULTISPECIES: hypothetical protein [Rhodobacterales]|nr:MULTISPECIES: hypothetical protein [Rhodobacterales]
MSVLVGLSQTFTVFPFLGEFATEPLTLVKVAAFIPTNCVDPPGLIVGQH